MRITVRAELAASRIRPKAEKQERERRNAIELARIGNKPRMLGPRSRGHVASFPAAPQLRGVMTAWCAICEHGELRFQRNFFRSDANSQIAITRSLRSLPFGSRSSRRQDISDITTVPSADRQPVKLARCNTNFAFSVSCVARKISLLCSTEHHCPRLTRQKIASTDSCVVRCATVRKFASFCSILSLMETITNSKKIVAMSLARREF